MTIRLTILILINASICFANPQAFLNQYCIECHGEDKQKGKLRLDQWANPSPKLIDLVIDQLEHQDMPPEDELQPKPSEIKSFISQIQPKAKTIANDFFRRFNRDEYFHTVMDLLEFPQTTFDPTRSFPQDPSDTQSTKRWDQLITSEFYLKALIESVDTCIEKAFHFSPKPKSQQWIDLPSPQMHFEARRSYKKKEYIHLFNKGHYSYLKDLKEGVPHDGYYTIQVKAQSFDRVNPYQEFLKLDQTIPARLGICSNSLKFGPNLHWVQNGMTSLAEFDIKHNKINHIKFRAWFNKGDVPTIHYSNGVLDWRTSGFRIIAARGLHYKDTYIKGNTYNGERTINLFPKIVSEEVYPKIRVHELKIEGPFYDSYPPRSHTKWISPKKALNPESSWKAIDKFASQAFRRPLTEFETQNLKTVLHESLKRGESIEQATKEVFKTILCMPNFLYQFIEPDKLTQTKVMERLNLLFTSNPNSPFKPKTNLKEHVEKLLDHKDSWHFIQGFLNQWLKLDHLGHMAPDKKLFPSYYIDNLQNSMRRETELFFAYCLKHNLDIEHFIDSDFIFVNRDLCRLYGIDPSIMNSSKPINGIHSAKLSLNAAGTQKYTSFAKVTNYDHRRGGLLGQASVLTLTANGTDTNPILRGVWFLESFLGQKPKLPSTDVPELEPDIRGSKTIREQLEKHRDSPQCASCHQKIDPPGFVLENYDPIGRWRNLYHQPKNTNVDSRGTLFKQPFNDIVEFKQLLKTRKDVLAKTIITHLLEYALGREMKVYDAPAINAILKNVQQKNYGLKTLILEVVESPLVSGGLSEISPRS